MSSGFLGRGWKFPVQVDPVTGRFMMSSGEEDIAESLGIIIKTIKGERVMRPTFGSTLIDYIFNSNDLTTQRMLESELRNAITTWEPRVDQVKVSVNSDPETPERLMINIQYTVRATNNMFNQVFPYYLNEGIS